MQQAIETPTIGQSYLQMPYNLYVWLRKEFMCLCGDQLEAMIMRVVEYEIEGDRRAWVRHATELIEQGKPAPEEPEWWITLSHKQIVTRLYDVIKNEKTLRTKLKSLVEDKKFLLMRDNPNNHYGAPQYTINKALVQEKLNGLPPLPGISEAAKSQATPLPNLVPPPNDTSSRNRQEGGTYSGTSHLPKVAPVTSQNRGVPPTKSGRTNKKRKNTENSNKNSEKRNDDLMSSPPDDSSFVSSDLNLSQGGVADPPPGVEAAPPIATTMPEMQNEHDDISHDAQGYKTSNSDAVMKNSTVMEKMLLDWLATLETELTEGKIKRFAVGRIAEMPADMQRLLSAVHGPDDVRGIYNVVRSQALFSDGRIIWGTNLAKEESIAAWQESCAGAGQQEDLQPLTESSRNDLERDIRAAYPTLWIQAIDDEFVGLALIIWYGDAKEDYMLIRCRADWKAWHDDPLLGRALAYADLVAQREAIAG